MLCCCFFSRRDLKESRNFGILGFDLLYFCQIVKSFSLVNASNNKQQNLRGYGSFWEIFYAVWYWVVAYPYVNR